MKRAPAFALLLASCFAVPANAETVKLPDHMAVPPSFPKGTMGEAPKLNSADAPAPTPRPDIAPLGYAPVKPDANPLARAVPPDLPPPKGVLPVDEIACRTELQRLGAEFAESEPQGSAAGCSMPFPVTMKAIAAGVTVEPEVTVNCATALASARFTADVIQKAARSTLGSPVKSIRQASGYVCRPRNGTTKLSEHAFGNALDIASFTLENGTTIDVKPSLPSNEQQFLTAVRSAACGPFKTVLGPGSNADHEFHLHFDLEHRRNGSAYCR